MHSVVNTVRDLSKQFPITTSEATALVTQISKLGVTAPAQIDLVAKSMTKLGIATGENTAFLTQGMVELGRQMGTSASNIDKYANSLYKVSTSAGVSASQVLAFSQSISPMARAAGIGETAVMGISAAFVKAGADSGVAANTFQSILSDIVNLIQSGSPDLAKYANLIGVTVDEFKNMDKAQAMSAIFETINKAGPDSVKILNRLGLDGIRAAKAIQAVSQSSGGLSKAISDATAAYGGGDLNKAAGAATSGLFDQLDKIKNQWKLIGISIGQNFITPLQWALKPLEAITSAINTIAASPFGKVASGIAAGVGAVAGTGGAALMGLGLAGKVLMGSWIARGPVSAALGGFRAGRTMDAAGRYGPEVADNPWARSYARGDMRNRPWQSLPFLAGQGFGQAFRGNGGPPGLASLITAPFRVGTWFANAQSDWAKEAAKPGYERTAGPGEAAYSAVASRGRILRSAVAHPVAFFQGMQGARADTGVTAGVTTVTEARNAKDAADATKDLAKKATDAGAAHSAAAKAATGLAKETKSAAAAAGGLAAASIKTTLTMNAQAIKAAGGLGGMALSSGKGLLGALGMGSPILGIATIGLGAKMFYDQYKEDSKKQKELTQTDLNPIQRYNDALGITTTKLTSFGSALDSAMKSLPTVSSVQEAMNISPSVQALASTPGFKPQDELLGKLPNDKARQQYLSTLNITDPRQLQLIEADLLNSVGNNLKRAQEIIDGAFNGQAVGNGNQLVNPGGLYNTMGSMQGQVTKWYWPFAARPDKNASLMAGAAVGQIGNQYLTDQYKYNQTYAGMREAGNIGALLAPGLTGRIEKASPTSGWSTNQNQPGGSQFKAGESDRGVVFRWDDSTKKSFLGVISALEQQYNNGKSFGIDWQKAIQEAGNKGTDVTRMSESQRSTWALQQLWGSEGGKSMLQGMGVKRAEDIPNLPSLAEQNRYAYTNPTAMRIRATKLGEIAYSDTAAGSVIQNAINRPGDVNAQFEARNSLLRNAKDIAGGFSGASSELQKMKAAIQDTTDPLYILADAAQQLSESLRQQSTVSMGREGAFGSNAGAAIEMMQSTGPDAAQRQQQGMQLGFQSINQMRDFMAGVRGQQINYGIQLERMTKDRNTSLYRTERDYQYQVGDSYADFYKSRLRSQEDFNRSMKRSVEDAAASMYDPYTRVMSRITDSGDTLLQNLKDQNEQIARQVQEVNKLRKAGLSQNAVDVLDLMNPAQAQQLSRLTGDIQNQPGLIKQINAQVEQRMTNTKDLVQSPYSKTFRRAQEDFQTQADRAAQDFATSMGRMARSHSNAMADAAQDFKTTTDRMAADIANSFNEVTGDLGQVIDQTKQWFVEHKNEIGPYADTIIASLDREKTAWQQLQAQIESYNKTPVIPKGLTSNPNKIASLARGLDKNESQAATADNSQALINSINTMNVKAAGNIYINGKTAGKASGGYITGPGTSMSDSIPAMLSHGEYVVNASAVNKVGVQFLNDINAGKVARHALGGMAGMAAAYKMLNTSSHATPTVYKGGTNIVTYDQSMKITGPITVQAQDPNAMQKALEAKKRLNRLAKPAQAST